MRAAGFERIVCAGNVILIVEALDWWYVDDLAEQYRKRARAYELFATHLGHRVFVPAPAGSGQDVLDWLESIGDGSASL